LLVFITPYVIDEPDKTTPATKEEMDKAKKRLEDIRQGLDATMEKLNK
jgi:type II secretory pathway component GspD/PulD (secretin)